MLGSDTDGDCLLQYWSLHCSLTVGAAPDIIMVCTFCRIGIFLQDGKKYCASVQKLGSENGNYMGHIIWAI